MKMTLNHEEINEAIVDWVAKQGIDLADKETTVELTAGRGMNGNSASIDIKPKQTRITNQVEYLKSIQTEEEYNPGETITDDPEAYPQTVVDVTEVEPTIPDDTPVLHTGF